jgi:hypothetical protein
MNPAVFVTTILLAALLGIALGIMLGRFVWPSTKGADPVALARAQAEVDRLCEECAALRSRADQLDAQRKGSADETRRLREDAARLTSMLSLRN